MNETQAKTTENRKDLESQRKILDETQKDRDAHFQDVVRLTEELNETVNQQDLLKKRTAELAKDLLKAETLLRNRDDVAALPRVVFDHITRVAG